MEILKNFGTTVVMLLVVAIIAIAIVTIILCVKNPSVKDYPLEKYFVKEGDSAWKIYERTCSNIDWTSWSEYVAKTNKNVNIGKLRVGDVIYIPVKK